MEKPEKPWPPRKWEFERDSEEVQLYWYRELIDEDLDEEGYKEEWDDEGYKAPSKSFCEMTLADLVAMAPSGVSLDQIKIRTTWPRYVQWIDYIVYYERALDKKAQRAEFDAKMKEYKAAFAKYEEDLKVYEKWSAEEALRKAEEAAVLAKKRVKELKARKPK